MALMLVTDDHSFCDQSECGLYNYRKVAHKIPESLPCRHDGLVSPTCLQVSLGLSLFFCGLNGSKQIGPALLKCIYQSALWVD